MTRERLHELDRLSSDAIKECQLCGAADDTALAFWRGVKTVVEELKMELKTPGSREHLLSNYPPCVIERRSKPRQSGTGV